MFPKLLLLLVLTISCSRSDDNSLDPGYKGILHGVRRLFSRTTDSVPSTADSESTDSDSPVYSYVKSIPIIKYDLNVTFDSSKLRNVIDSIGKASSDVGQVTKSVLRAPLDVLSVIKNSTTNGLTNLQARSENSSILNIANSIPIINQFGPKIKEISQQIQFIKPGNLHYISSFQLVGIFSRN